MRTFRISIPLFPALLVHKLNIRIYRWNNFFLGFMSILSLLKAIPVVIFFFIASTLAVKNKTRLNRDFKLPPSWCCIIQYVVEYSRFRIVCIDSRYYCIFRLAYNKFFITEKSLYLYLSGDNTWGDGSFKSLNVLVHTFPQSVCPLTSSLEFF